MANATSWRRTALMLTAVSAGAISIIAWTVLRGEPAPPPLTGIAALRRGETENCVECRGESSCIIPLSLEAIHRKREGSSDAIRFFSEYLRSHPDDLGARWLLNLAAMTLGDYPRGVPSQYLIP